MLLEIEDFDNNIWEPACGDGSLSKVFEAAGKNVRSTDIVNRGYGETLDFFDEHIRFDGDIITNPPYKYAQEFVNHALDLVKTGHKVAMFLKLQFLEGKQRRKLFSEFPPKTVWVSSSRLLCAKNAEFDYMKSHGGSAVAYAWYVWEKGYKGDTVIKWFN